MSKTNRLACAFMLTMVVSEVCANVFGMLATDRSQVTKKKYLFISLAFDILNEFFTNDVFFGYGEVVLKDLEVFVGCFARIVIRCFGYPDESAEDPHFCFLAIQ